MALRAIRIPASLSPLGLGERGGQRSCSFSGPRGGRWTWWLAAAPLSPAARAPRFGASYDLRVLVASTFSELNGVQRSRLKHGFKP